MQDIPSESINLVILDPPYNIGIAEWDTKTSIETYIKSLMPILQESLRVLKNNGELYIFGNFNYIADIKCALNNQKCKLKSWIIWDKGAKEQNATRNLCGCGRTHIVLCERN